MSATPPSRAEKRTLEQSNHTPVTIASYSVEPTEVTNVAQAGEDIKKEMGYSIFANRPDFIDTFFDKVDKQQCQHILDSLVVKGLYKPNARTRKTPPWTKLPRKPTDETSLYAPLVDVLNIITEQEGSTHDGLRLLWRDVHDKAPKTVLNEASTDTLPDVIGEYVANKAALTKAPWWYRIAILIKSTKATREDKTDPENPTLVQLLEYARQTFKEQPFRRFLFGITFHCADMTFWHFDRAGGIGSIMINIHDEPLTFIQCIASCVAMSPVELGFDPTFEAYDTKDKTTFKPWKIPSKLLEPGALSKKTLPRAHWVVSMPGDYRKSGDEREDFVLFAAVSLNHTEVMKGRAGRSWFARKRSEMEQKNLELCKTYVLKDNWHDSRNPAEGSMYKAQGDVEGIARMYSYETVHINGEKDSTINVRRGLIVPEDAKPMSLRKAVELMEQPEEDYYSNCFQRYSNSLPVNYKEWLEWWTEENKPHPIYHRDHNRLLLSSYGHSITDFLDREELLVVFKDTINGHRILVEKKFLHQHISRRNIAISEEDSPNKGLLVDQDYTIADFENHSATADVNILSHSILIVFDGS
ncbi:hypothetical protein C8Q75DRAFT_619441 [Abortiporus biennis]|nr:hypothetical protein C8Q75DRAFT_619441 [Abortiporus biennis]